jgi:flagellar biogenesis protein FliO
MDPLRQFLTVLFVLLLLVAALYLLRRKGLAGLPRTVGGSRQRRRIELLERLPIHPQHTLVLVRFGGRELLVSTAPSGCSLLAEEAVRPADREPFSGSGEFGA